MSSRNLVGMDDRGWRNALSSIVRSDDEVARREAADTSGRHGGTPVTSLPGRCRATLCGTLRSVTVDPSATCCNVEAELFDGSGTVRLRWIGRESIAGIEPGRQVRVTGTMSHCSGGERLMYNPAYELLPQRS